MPCARQFRLQRTRATMPAAGASRPRSSLDRARLERGFAVLHVDAELDAARAVPLHQGVAILLQRRLELFVGEAVDALAALLFERDEVVEHLAPFVAFAA